ncbi:DUF6282 family protein [Chloroflexota bacterium]
MPGKAYNPKGFEPEMHERMDAPSPEVMELHRKVVAKERAQRPKRVTYKETQEYRRRGESHILGHYVYEQWFDVYSGIEDELLNGAWDSHLHIYPDYVPRRIDMIDLAIDASKAGMAGVVCKDHFFSNVGAAWGAQRFVDDMVRRGELEQSCQVLGTIMLAWSHDPIQVHLGRKYPNLGGIFFSTMSGRGGCGPDLPILDSKGKLLSEVKECMDVCGENRICIMSGHRTPDEQMAMAEYAHKIGARILITHAGSGPLTSTLVAGSAAWHERIEQCREMGRLGAYLEIGGNKCIPNILWPCVDPNLIIDIIKAFGPKYCVANTDFGQIQCTHPLEEFKLYIRIMLHRGLSKEDIKLMIQTNPAKALYLED